MAASKPQDSKAKGMFSWLKKKAKVAGGVVQTGAGKVSGAAVESATYITDKSKEAASAVGAGVSKASDVVVDTVQTGASKVSETVSESAVQITDKSKVAAGFVGEGVSKASGAVVDTVQSGASKVAAAPGNIGRGASNKVKKLLAPLWQKLQGKILVIFFLAILVIGLKFVFLPLFGALNETGFLVGPDGFDWEKVKRLAVNFGVALVGMLVFVVVATIVFFVIRAYYRSRKAKAAKQADVQG